MSMPKKHVDLKPKTLKDIDAAVKKRYMAQQVAATADAKMAAAIGAARKEEATWRQLSELLGWKENTLFTWCKRLGVD